ncbi:Ni2+-binding GTPase [Saccharibacillus alkalitolerans]|uniref:Ni2+-binding GTPase n=1 Tax=Saccharibacillus alkalitolerans TaxID=2705290 RepID=A0ABX0F0Z0_9BACL|nr:Ni2+-binding GTPase [Saccharibacillus alkalitolerans]NGZ74195.1 Ni2+-binding GTPase [Saccharibacillus alkalitolerans]
MSEYRTDDEERLKRLRERGVLNDEETEWIQAMLLRLAETEAQNKRLREALLKANGRKPTMSTKLRDALYE